MIEHDRPSHRFVLEHQGHLAYLAYQRDGSLMTITTTQVPAAIAGQGVAGRLNEAALLFARSAGLKVAATCSYSQSWLRRHRQYQDLLEE